ncbi:MAG: TldD/PmbA family protein [Candidatus Thorarchaeota archaeon]
MKNELLELGAQVIKYSEKQGATQIESYLESTRIVEVNIEKGRIRMASEKHDAGCGIRVIIGNQLGVSYVTSILTKDLEQAVLDAISAARASVPDPDFKSLSSVTSSYPSVKGLFDKEIERIGCDHAVELMARAVQASQEVSGKERNLIEGRFSAKSKTRVVVNSLGVNGISSETKADLELSSTIGVGEDQCSSWDEQESRSLETIDPEKIGTMSANNALELRSAKQMEGGDMPLILTPRALWTVIGTGLGEALDARQIQDGKSYLIDSIGSQISSPELKIVDNGILPSALGSRPFDAEGVPSQCTSIIDSGVLQSYLHDSYSSEKVGVKNTGNATRKSYNVAPTIGVTNLVVSPGDSTLDEMVTDMNRGVLCTFTFDRPNFVTGELSAMIMEGFLIHKGEVQHALKSTLFGVSMLDLLRKTILVGSDVETRGSVISPSLMIESVKITSG